MTTINGTVKWYNGRKGFGFVARDDGGSDIFLHATAVKAAGLRYVNEGEKYSFELEDGPKGPSAINLKKIES
jgi:CspA family cold shock protein